MNQLNKKKFLLQPISCIYSLCQHRCEKFLNVIAILKTGIFKNLAINFRNNILAQFIKKSSSLSCKSQAHPKPCLCLNFILPVAMFLIHCIKTELSIIYPIFLHEFLMFNVLLYIFFISYLDSYTKMDLEVGTFKNRRSGRLYLHCIQLFGQH